jgi:hypothetical protein
MDCDLHGIVVYFSGEKVPYPLDRSLSESQSQVGRLVREEFTVSAHMKPQTVVEAIAIRLEH